MTLRSSDLQSDSDLYSIRNSCDVFLSIYNVMLMVLYQISKIGKCNQCNNLIHTSLSTPHFWRFKKIYQCQVEFTVLILPNLVVEHVSLKNLNAATNRQYNWQWSSLLEGNLEVDNAFQPQ